MAKGNDHWLGNRLVFIVYARDRPGPEGQDINLSRALQRGGDIELGGFEGETRLCGLGDEVEDFLTPGVRQGFTCEIEVAGGENGARKLVINAVRVHCITEYHVKRIVLL